MSKPLSFTPEQLPIVIPGLNIEHYHRGLSGYSKTDLDHFLLAPANVKARKACGDFDTKALLVGRALHTRIEFDQALESYNAQFVCEPKFEGEGSRTAKREWRKENADKKLLTETEWELVEGMFSGLKANPQTNDLIEARGYTEETIVWRDRETGVICKVRPDKRIAAGHSYLPENLLVDWKTTDEINPRELQRSITEYNYHLQAAMITEGVQEVLGVSPGPMVFAFTEKRASRRVLPVLVEESDLKIGHALFRTLLRQIADCEKNNYWPGFVTLGLTEWGRERDLARINGATGAQ